MLEINGSSGEGGGQMLRTALGLSAATGLPFRMHSIRSRRPRPGLSQQHLHCIRAVCQVMGMESDASPGDSEITFRPGPVVEHDIDVEIATAGSVTLVLQTLLPLADVLDRPLRFRIAGGTDVRWSPPFDHTACALLPALSRLGVDVDLECRRRGHYPRGGGLIAGTIHPAKYRRFRFEGVPEEGAVFIHSSSLPAHVHENMAREVERRLPGIEVFTEVGESLSPGAGMVLVFSGPSSFVASSALAERGVPAQKVARRAVDGAFYEMSRGAALDYHTADQLIPIMALNPEASSFITSRMSGHLSTNMEVAAKFTGRSFKVSSEGVGVRVSVT